MQSYLALAKEEGGKILCGGDLVEMKGDLKGGYYMRPAVIEGLSITCRTNQEEIFGPVVTIEPFDTKEEAWSLANGAVYGLASTLWTNS